MTDNKAFCSYVATISGLSIALLLSGCGPVEDPGISPEFDARTAAPIPKKPMTKPNPQRNLYWGDLHIHTSYSTDAWLMGVRALPDDAYTFARGGEIRHAGGYGIRLQRPLDFAAVTDHSEYLGVLRDVSPETPLNEKSFSDRIRNDGRLLNTLAWYETVSGFDLKAVAAKHGAGASRSAWVATINAAEAHNVPGEFTAFIAYEWSSAPDKDNLHRNVIYRDSKVPDIPYSSLNSNDPEDLWAELERQRQNGASVFAIPHNGNASNGRMYGAATFDGAAMTANYATERMRNEPLSEIFQVKGASETHPQLSPQDDFADFEIVDIRLAREADISEPRGSYARDALRLGIEMSHSEGFNPYQFGVIGSSDGHNASSPVEEDGYHGKLPILDGSAATRLRTNTFLPQDLPGGPSWGSGGLAAVWAEENTRGSLFDAMSRKETYATSGPRIMVRLFGGWNYPADLLSRPDWVEVAQKGGVPMGGMLSPSLDGRSPIFAVWAARDPQTANLDRIQIIKGWVTSDGKSMERVTDVVWAGNRALDADGNLPPLGNTVNVSTASFDNSIGEAQLFTLWTDPDFDPDQEAFYYARVIQIQTPRWSTYDAVSLGVEAPHPAVHQERAVTSAIWFSP